jgi:hypothetical protein
MGLSRSKFASELITHSDDEVGGILILLAVRCHNTWYDNNFNSKDGTNTLGNNEGLSRSKFASELVITRSDDDGGSFASRVRSDSKLYDADETLLD